MLILDWFQDRFIHKHKLKGVVLTRLPCNFVFVLWGQSLNLSPHKNAFGRKPTTRFEIEIEMLTI